MLDFEQQIPDLLWHYTSMEGLSGILSSKELWMTNIFYLNDSMEHLLFRRLVSDVAKEHIHSPEISTIIQDLFNQDDVAHFYVTCLSNDGDMLPQWRAYADDGRGAAIGFRRAELELCGNLPMTNIRKVVYDPDEQRRICMQALAEQHFDDRPPDHSNWSIRLIAAYLLQVAAKCKDAGFVSEQEYRIIHQLTFDDNERLRISKGNSYSDRLSFRVDHKKRVVPYVKLPLDLHQLTISKVCLGPKAKDALTKSAIEMMLHTNEFEEWEITESKLTYR